MELKEYQQTALKSLRRYLESLDKASVQQKALEQAGIDIPFSVTETAWKDFFKPQSKLYYDRQNGLGESIPFVCLKVPTGGGKTLLAARAIDLIKTGYLKRASTLVLWIVPSEAIYQQTLKALRNREHPYRQFLDQSSGGRTVILEKADRFNPVQLQEQLAVLLLMLPSANRQDKKTLKMFQDTSGFESFFPHEDDWLANKALVERYPNLEYYGPTPGGPLITSLGNTLRLLKPMVIIDEGHLAYSEGALATVNSFNPSFILELSATPDNKRSNILVSIGGHELNREEMIKLDLNVYNYPGMNWKDTLAASVQKLHRLEETALEYQSNTGRYIRPICLIQVERTGKDQKTDTKFIHADEARQELIKQGIHPNAIAIKSSENDGLENVDLLAEDCPIQYIITRKALQEGWDCPFAYILVVLTNPTSQVSITQLVGRVLRQPYARKTGLAALDQSYVYCFRSKANEMLDAIRRGFDEEGLGDLSHRAHTVEGTSQKEETIGIRPGLQHLASKIYLPRFVIDQPNAPTRLLSYEMDILSRVDWRQVALEEKLEIALGVLPSTVQITGYNVAGSGSGVQIVDKTGGETQALALPLDPTFVSLQLSDIATNPWVAYDFAKRAIDKMLEQYDQDRERVAANMVLIVSMLRKVLEDERDRLARQAFHDLVKQKTVRFVLDVDYGYLLPDSIRVQTNATTRRLTRSDNSPLQLSFREWLPEDDFNEPEKEIAVYLDKQTQLILWWDRNYSRQGYSIQGWHRDKIYPDFLLGKRDPSDASQYSELRVIETKGRHLDNPDTAYKKSVLELCNQLAREWDASLGAYPDAKGIEFLLVFFDEAESKINESLKNRVAVKNAT